MSSSFVFYIVKKHTHTSIISFNVKTKKTILNVIRERKKETQNLEFILNFLLNTLNVCLSFFSLFKVETSNGTLKFIFTSSNWIEYSRQISSSFNKRNQYSYLCGFFFSFSKIRLTYYLA